MKFTTPEQQRAARLRDMRERNAKLIPRKTTTASGPPCDVVSLDEFRARKTREKDEHAKSIPPND